MKHLINVLIMAAVVLPGVSIATQLMKWHQPEVVAVQAGSAWSDVEPNSDSDGFMVNGPFDFIVETYAGMTDEEAIAMLTGSPPHDYDDQLVGAYNAFRSLGNTPAQALASVMNAMPAIIAGSIEAQQINP